ncbi:phosphodiester glycosidase family protein [soil metagenome]
MSEKCSRDPRIPRRRTFWERWPTRIAVIVILVTVAGVGLYPSLESIPGYAPWQDKASTVIRTIGLGGPLDAFENWLYSRHPPSDTAPDVRGRLTAASGSSPATYPYLPPLAVTADGRGWRPVTRSAGDPPMVDTALIQPDRLHRSVVVGVALIQSSAARAHLVAGTAEPPGTGSPGRTPPDRLADVVAAFNSGFKMSAHPGGFLLNGDIVRELVVGKASAVIDDRGRLTVGQWGRDVKMSPHVRTVRQNLALIVEGGRPVHGLDRNADLRWGSAKNQLQYTWRSGLGVTARGDVLYVAGDKLNLATLGAALAQAGAVTGMELDIHSGLESFSAWQSDGTGVARPRRLLSTMSGPAGRFIDPDLRDFFYFTTAGAAENAPG